MTSIIISKNMLDNLIRVISKNGYYIQLNRGKTPCQHGTKQMILAFVLVAINFVLLSTMHGIYTHFRLLYLSTNKEIW